MRQRMGYSRAVYVMIRDHTVLTVVIDGCLYFFCKMERVCQRGCGFLALMMFNVVYVQTACFLTAGYYMVLKVQIPILCVMCDAIEYVKINKGGRCLLVLVGKELTCRTHDCVVPCALVSVRLAGKLVTIQFFW